MRDPATAQPHETIADRTEILRRLSLKDEPGTAASLRPFLLSGPDALWLVTAGQVDVLSARITLHGEVTARRYLFSVATGQLLCGLGLRPLEHPLELVALGSLDLSLRRIKLEALLAVAETPQLESQKSGPMLLAEWTSMLAQSAKVLTQTSKLPPILDPSVLGCTPSAEVAAALSRFQQAMLKALIEGEKRELAQEKLRLRGLTETETQLIRGSLGMLSSVLEDQRTGDSSADDKAEPLQSVCKRVWKAQGIAVNALPTSASQDRRRDPLLRLAQLARLRVRPVRLQEEWWSEDHGPLVAFRQANGNPVALIPSAGTSYEIFDDTRGTREVVNRAMAETLAPQAYCFYRKLPETSLGFLDVARFCMASTRAELVAIASLGVTAGLLAAVPPAVTGLIFQTVIPGAQRSQLLQLVVALVISALSVTLIGVSRSLMLTRLEGKISAALNAAVWDRLLGLPVRFFRAYSAGDLAQRAFGIQQVFGALSGQTLDALLAGLYGLFSAALMFLYDAELALLGMVLVLCVVIVTAVTGVLQQRKQRQLAAMRGRLSSVVLQLVAGAPKLRVTGSEPRAFRAWVKEFVVLRRLARSLRSPLQVFDSVFPLFALMVLYYLAGSTVGAGTRSAGRFLGFLAAFQTFLSMSRAAARAVLSLAAVAPALDRLRPLLETVPEISPNQLHPGVLSGEIELSHVSFRYKPEGAAILEDVSLRVQAGEFVAITGPSGSGKSTLLRLLLGFEKPSSGAIYYDRQDFQTLDACEVRRQFGVVLQDGKLFEGSIFENIVGSTNLSIEDAREAARMAGFERDLAQLPMGLHTPLQAGGGQLSGGQRQRLLIARAIVTRPRLLYFDEATSALDNKTQAEVAASIDRLTATRVVIAHRLSTLVNADRIIVLQAGRIVQTGTYRELMAQPGLFAELAQRQLTGEN